MLVEILVVIALLFPFITVGYFRLYRSGLAGTLRAMRKFDEFTVNQHEMTLIKSGIKPSVYVGFALDDLNKKMLCVNEGFYKVCDYDQILEWRVLVNNRTVAYLSRLSSADLKVEDPDRTLGLDDFLRKHCPDQQSDPVLKSVVIKFLIRDLGYPVHTVNMQEVGAGIVHLPESLKVALGHIDKFKIVMYQGA